MSNRIRLYKGDSEIEIFVEHLTKYLNNGWSENKDQPKPKKVKKKEEILDPVGEYLKEENNIQKENEE